MKYKRRVVVNIRIYWVDDAKEGAQLAEQMSQIILRETEKQEQGFPHNIRAGTFSKPTFRTIPNEEGESGAETTEYKTKLPFNLVFYPETEEEGKQQFEQVCAEIEDIVDLAYAMHGFPTDYGYELVKGKPTFTEN